MEKPKKIKLEITWDPTEKMFSVDIEPTPIWSECERSLKDKINDILTLGETILKMYEE